MSRATGEFFNAEADIQPIFDENLPAALFLIEWAIEKKAGSSNDNPIRDININKKPESKKPFIQGKIR